MKSNTLRAFKKVKMLQTFGLALFEYTCDRSTGEYWTTRLTFPHPHFIISTSNLISFETYSTLPVWHTMTPSLKWKGARCLPLDPYLLYITILISTVINLVMTIFIFTRVWDSGEIGHFSCLSVTLLHAHGCRSLWLS